MLTKVEVDNLQGGLLALPLQDVSAGYVLKEVEGLGPVKASISSSTFAQLDGSQKQGARRDNRNLLIKLGFEPDYASQSVSSLREALYAYLMPKMDVLLKFFIDGDHFVNINGQVEAFEPSIFSKDPGVDVSIICFDPNFIAPTATQVAGNTVSTTTEQTVVYTGTVENGFLFTLNIDRSLSAFTFYNRRPDGTIRQIDVAYAFVAGDVVEISTEPKNKYITLTRAGVTTSILYAVPTQARWSPLNPGNNYIRVYATGAAIPWTIDYFRKYGGL